MAQFNRDLDTADALKKMRTGMDAISRNLGVELGAYEIKFGIVADDEGKNTYANKLLIFFPESKEFFVNKQLFDAISGEHDLGREKALISIARESALVLEAYAAGDTIEKRALYMTLAHRLEYVGKSRAAQTLLAVIGASAMFDPDGENWDEIPVRMLSHIVVHDKNRAEEIQQGFMTEQTLSENITLANHMIKEKKNFVNYAIYYSSLLPKLADGDDYKRDCFRDLLGDIIAAALLIDHTKQETENFVSGFYREVIAFKRMSERSLPRVRRRTVEVEELHPEKDAARDN